MAENIMHIGTIQETMHNLGIDDIRHPLVEVVELNRLPALTGYNGQWVSYGFYCVILKTKFCAEIQYGRSHYDYDSGTLVFFAPNQPMQVNLVSDPEGVVLMFQPELIRGTAVAF